MIRYAAEQTNERRSIRLCSANSGGIVLRLAENDGDLMLEYMMIEPGGVLRVKPFGALTVADFQGLARYADAYLSQHGTIGGLLIEAQAFPGWDGFAAFGAHFRFLRDHQRQIQRVAVVSDSPIAHVAERLAEPFIAADIRGFAATDGAEALAWLQADRRDAPRILIVLTSHRQLGATGRRTGFWLEEFASPYYVFTDAGATLTLASPEGGGPPVDPASDDPESATQATRRFKADRVSQALLAHSLPLRDVSAGDFDGVFYPGGHGPLWDLAEDAASIALIEATFAGGKPVAAVCHAPGVLRHVKAANHRSVVSGKMVTGFSNTEERAVGLTDVVPFSVEDMLTSEGGVYSKAADWLPHVVTDGLLITGQNPASSGGAGRALLDTIQSVNPRYAGGP
jgi:putative intracellular protease/amidase